MRYRVLICGGFGDNVWDKEIIVEGKSFKEAVDKAHEKLEIDSDIVEMEQID